MNQPYCKRFSLVDSNGLVAIASLLVGQSIRKGQKLGDQRVLKTYTAYAGVLPAIGWHVNELYGKADSSQPTNEERG